MPRPGVGPDAAAAAQAAAARAPGPSELPGRRPSESRVWRPGRRAGGGRRRGPSDPAAAARLRVTGTVTGSLSLSRRHRLCGHDNDHYGPNDSEMTRPGGLIWQSPSHSVSLTEAAGQSPMITDDGSFRRQPGLKIAGYQVKARVPGRVRASAPGARPPAPGWACHAGPVTDPDTTQCHGHGAGSRRCLRCQARCAGGRRQSGPGAAQGAQQASSFNG